jgi:hypothetical protein
VTPSALPSESSTLLTTTHPRYGAPGKVRLRRSAGEARPGPRRHRRPRAHQPQRRPSQRMIATKQVVHSWHRPGLGETC